MTIDTKRLRELLALRTEFPWDVDTRNEIIAHAPMLLDHIDALEAEIARLRAERDALREALYEAVTEEEAYQSSNGWLDQAKAALAQEQGEKHDN